MTYLSDQLDTEQWSPIAGYETYEVSTFGRVRSPRGVLSQWLDGNGRPSVRLYRKNIRRDFRVHRLVLEAFVGLRPPGLEACHGDGDPTNNRLTNLRWDTRAANQADSVRHGTHVQARKTECSRGHELADWNLVTAEKAKGRRWCLACSRAVRLGYYYTKTGQPVDVQALSDQKFSEIKTQRQKEA